MNDLQMQLTPDTKLKELRIVSEFPGYNELMQRAVTLLMLSNSRDFFIDGMPIYELIEKSNAVNSDILESALKSIAQILKEQLEEDGEELEAVDITCSVIGRDKLVTIDITRTDGEVFSGGLIA